MLKISKGVQNLTYIHTFSIFKLISLFLASNIMKFINFNSLENLLKNVKPEKNLRMMRSATISLLMVNLRRMPYWKEKS
jgi:hypothetical protein